MMLSHCPSCMAEVDHEDHLFEVMCPSCSMHFNPYYNQDMASLDLGNVAAAKEQKVVTPPPFAESEAAFKELREFGEELARNETPDLGPKTITRPLTTGGTNEWLIVSGERLEGYRIDKYLPPISVLSTFDGGNDPLQSGFRDIWQAAQAHGANGIVGLRWSLTHGETKVLLTGTPIRCQKT